MAKLYGEFVIWSNSEERKINARIIQVSPYILTRRSNEAFAGCNLRRFIPSAEIDGGVEESWRAGGHHITERGWVSRRKLV
jgi:hypothetical protein